MPKYNSFCRVLGFRSVIFIVYTNPKILITITIKKTMSQNNKVMLTSLLRNDESCIHTFLSFSIAENLLYH